jgi:hypothetical protein
MKSMPGCRSAGAKSAADVVQKEWLQRELEAHGHWCRFGYSVFSGGTPRFGCWRDAPTKPHIQTQIATV